MLEVANKFQRLLQRSHPAVKVETISDRRLNLKPKKNGIYLGIRSINRSDEDEIHRLLKLAGAGLMTILEEKGERMAVYFVAVREGDQ